MKYVRKAINGSGSSAIIVMDGFNAPIKASAKEKVVSVLAEYIKAGPKNSRIAAMSLVVNAISEPVEWLW